MGLILLDQGIDISGDFTEDDFNNALDIFREKVTSGQIGAVARQLVHAGPDQRRRHRRHRLVGRRDTGQRRAGQRPLRVRHPGVGRHAVERQPDDPDRLAPQGQRRGAHQLLLRARGRGGGRPLGELHHPGRGREGGRGRDRPRGRREPADLPERGDAVPGEDVPPADRRRGAVLRGRLSRTSSSGPDRPWSRRPEPISSSRASASGSRGSPRSREAEPHDPRGIVLRPCSARPAAARRRRCGSWPDSRRRPRAGCSSARTT